MRRALDTVRSPRGRHAGVTIRRRGIFAGLGASLLLFGLAATPASATIDDLIASCPSTSEITAFQSDFDISVEADASATSPCPGSPTVTESRRRVFQVLQLLRSLSFARPLPWTSLAPYDWLRGAIAGIRVQPNLGQNFCCDPPRVINIDASAVGDPWNGESLLLTLATFMHEARHAEIGGHTCAGGRDMTFDEQGANAIEEWIVKWIGLFGGTATAAAAPHAPSYYREFLLERTSSGAAFCDAPSTDLQVRTETPSEVATGSRLDYAVTLLNAGAAAAPRTYLSHDPSPGLGPVSASTNLGPCLLPDQTGGGPVVCELGTLAPNQTVTAAFTYTVTAAPGSVLGGLDSSRPVGAPRVTADVTDLAPANNAPPETINVVDDSGSGTLEPSVDLRGRARTTRQRRKVIVRPGVTISCPAGGAACTAVATLAQTRKGRARRVVIAEATIQVQAGATKALKLELNRRGRRLLEEESSLRATLTLLSSVAGEEPLRNSKTLSIEPPRR